MRAIGQLPDEASAKRFSDYLLVEGVPNQVELEEGRWTLWVHEDDHIERARQALAEFLRQPTDRKYRQSAPTARELREKERQEEKNWRKRFFDRQSLRPGGPVRVGAVTALLMALCLGVAMLKSMQGDESRADSRLVRALRITDYSTGEGFYTGGLPEIRGGQIWRLVTPIFEHFGWLHVIFNLFWLMDLGSLLEARQSSLRLAIKVIILASVSNLCQYAVDGPFFGGMSGVVYGLFGYIWARSKVDLRCGLYLQPMSVAILVAWFVLCLTNVLRPVAGISVANMAHAAGLGLGLVWGFLAGKLNAP